MSTSDSSVPPIPAGNVHTTGILPTAATSSRLPESSPSPRRFEQHRSRRRQGDHLQLDPTGKFACAAGVGGDLEGEFFKRDCNNGIALDAARRFDVTGSATTDCRRMYDGSTDLAARESAIESIIESAANGAADDTWMSAR